MESRSEDILGSTWWRLKYELRPDALNAQVWKITPVRDQQQEPIQYDPLAAGGPNPEKMPLSRDDWKSAPHTHLARIHLGTDEETGDGHEILEFANKWGLLGLWKVDKYRLETPSLAFEDRGVVYPLVGQPYSAWYKAEPPLPQEPLARWCEPLDVCVLAIQQYQRFCTILAGEIEEYEKEEGRYRRLFEAVHGLFPRGIELQPILYPDSTLGFTWGCPSLLHACYLRMYLELSGGKRLVRCAFGGCSNLFITRDSRQMYCSRHCQDAQRKRVKRAAQRAKMEKGG